MDIRKSYLIIFLVVLAIAVDSTNAGWKFWKKDKDKDKEATTTIPADIGGSVTPVGSVSTITTSIATSTTTPKPSARGSIQKGIASAGDAGLAIGVGANGEDIKNNAKPRRPSPGTEVGQDFPGGPRPTRPAGMSGVDGKGYRDWAVDLTGAGEPIYNPNPPKGAVSSSPLPSVASTTPRTPSSTPRLIATAKPTTNPRLPSVNPVPTSVTQKTSTTTPSSPSSTGKSWAQIAGGGSRPGSPTPSSKPTNIHITPTQPQPPRSPTSKVSPAVVAGGAAAAAAAGTAVAASDSDKKYSREPTFSKGNTVTDEDLEKLCEALFIKDKNNAWKHLTLNLQKKTSSQSPVDESPQPLLNVNSAALQIPTIDKVLKIYDNYKLDTSEREQLGRVQREEESSLVDTFLSTDVMSSAMRFLSDKGYFKRDYYEYKYLLRRIWFTLYPRGNSKVGSSGFEHVFMTELKLGTEVIGLHNWIYFNAEEVKRRANYLGYMKKLDLGDKAAIIKLHATFNGIDKPVTSMFIGTSPELEMALYTVCFYARPDQSCPVQLGGTKFNIITHKFKYGGNDLIGSAYPDL